MKNPYNAFNNKIMGFKKLPNIKIYPLTRLLTFPLCKISYNIFYKSNGVSVQS